MTNPEVEIVPFDPQKVGAASWKALHVYRRARQAEAEPEDAPLADDAVEKLVLTPDPETQVLRLAVRTKADPETFIGWIYFEVYREGSETYENNKHMAWVDFAVLRPYRRQGLGTRMLAKVAELARKHDRTLLIGGTDEEDGKAFLRAIGAQMALEGRQSRLRMDAVDWEQVARWIAEGQTRSPETTLHITTDPVPDAVLEDYCAVLTAVSNQEPRGDLEVGDEVITPEVYRKREAKIAGTGATHLKAYTQEGDGAVSGLTEMGYFPGEGPLIRQWMTGVKDVYRGRGLGKWLKAGMLERMRRELPQVEVVRTGNATVNKPMLSINVRLGFQPHKEGVEAQIPVATVEAYLGARGQRGGPEAHPE